MGGRGQRVALLATTRGGSGTNHCPMCVNVHTSGLTVASRFMHAAHLAEHLPPPLLLRPSNCFSPNSFNSFTSRKKHKTKNIKLQRLFFVFVFCFLLFLLVFGLFAVCFLASLCSLLSFVCALSLSLCGESCLQNVWQRTVVAHAAHTHTQFQKSPPHHRPSWWEEVGCSRSRPSSSCGSLPAS